MNRSTAVALLLTSLSFPAFAQHGGGHGGGGGGHAGAAHSAPAFHSGSSAPARSSAYGQRPAGSRPGMPPNPASRRGPAIRYGAQPLNYGAQRAGGAEHRSPYRSPYRQPGRGGIIYENRYGRRGLYYSGYPYGLGYYGDYGFDDDSYYDDSDDAANTSDAPYYGPGQYNGFDPQGQDQAQDQPQSWPQGDGTPSDPSRGMAQMEPGSPYRPNYGAPQPVSHATAQPVVTLVFKDHRPNQQIRNYLINGDTLTVWDQHPHEISLDQLDIAATEKFNHEAGVEFYLPGAPR